MKKTAPLKATTFALLAGLTCGIPAMLSAESIAISPTKLDVPKSQQTTLTVTAGGRQISVVQLRVVKWDGRNPNKVSPTRDVVVSPPMAKLRPKQELTVRILRKKRRSVRGKECYRVLVDRLPGREQSKQAVKLQVRHSVPLCFTS